MAIILIGDPHGEYAEIIEQVLRLPGGSTVIFMGDLELRMPFREQLRPLFDAGFNLRWFLGNHDLNAPGQRHLFKEGSPGDPGFLFDDAQGGYSAGDIGNTVQTIEGFAVACLAGTFKGRVWDPKQSDARYYSREDWLKAHRQRWRGGLPIDMLPAIFPRDLKFPGHVAVADLLLTHEAPSTHLFGFRQLDDLCADMGAHMHVHGHHHRSYSAIGPRGAYVVGLAKRQVYVVDEMSLWLPTVEVTK
jgi:hypothetical protein